MYGLDRVKGVCIVHGKKYIDTGFDISDYFRHHVGITRSGEEPEEILVAFSRPQANYIITQPLHESQEMVGEEKVIPREAFHDQIREGQVDSTFEGSYAVKGGVSHREAFQEGLEVEDEEQGKVLFRFHLVPTFEFTSQLLGWGPAIEVISPEWLREEIVETLTASLLNYTKGV